MNYLLFSVFLFCILGLNLFSSGHYVLLSKEVMGPKCRQGFIGNSPGRDGETSLCTKSASHLQARPFPCGQSLFQLVSQSPATTGPGKGQGWGGGGGWTVLLPCSGESGRLNLGQHVTSNCGPAVMRNLPRAKEAVRPSGAWLQGTCTLSLGFLGTGPEELGERT